MANDSLELETLKEIPASEILAKIEKGEPVKYDHIRILGDLDLSNLKLLKRHVERTDTGINSFGLEEDITIVSSIIKIVNSEIRGCLDFSEAAFEAEVDFSGSHFNESVDFSGSQFIDTDADFAGSKFVGDALFYESQFRGWANFRGSVFKKLAGFLGSVFMATADFSESEFNEFTDFVECHFRIDANYSGSKFLGNTYFRKSEFAGNADFGGCEFGREARFDGSKFNGDSLSFEHSKFFNPVFQEDACRRAKNILEKNGNREEAGYHSYREMEAKRLQKAWYIRYPEYVFIQLIFGYGVHPFRLWAFWFGFVGIFAIIYWLGDGIDARASQLINNATIIDYTWFSIATAVTPGYAGYKPITEFKLVAGLEAIFGTFMWAAFIATFARKYMR